MQVTKKYKRGGFFGNSQDKFSDMEGAGSGINMAFANRGFLKGKGAALRREKRYLKKLERQGKLNEYGTQSADRLDYLRNVQKDRAKKGIAAGALAAGLAFGGPAALSAIKGGALKGGALKAAGKGGLKGLFKNAGNIKKGKEIFDALTPDQEAQIDSGNFYDDPSMNPFMMGGKMPKDKTSKDLLMALQAFEAKKRRESVPSITGRSMDDKEILRQLIETFAKKRRDVQSRPASIMG